MNAAFVLFWAIAGGFAAFVHLALLARSVRALMTGASGILAALAPMLRAATTVAVLALAARHGAVALMAALLGFVAMRSLLIRRAEKAL